VSENRLFIQYLSEEGLDQIEETAFRLLDEVGISLRHDGVSKMLYGHGCRVEESRVYIPRDVVRWALENIRPVQALYNRDGSLAFRYGDGQIRFHNRAGAPNIYDLETGERRSSTVEDVAAATRLLDALPNVDMIIPLFGPQNVPPEMLEVIPTGVMLRNTTKPTLSAAMEKSEHVPYVVEMAAACCGGMEAFRKNPWMSIMVSPISPLTFSYDGAATIIAAVESGAPFYSLPAPIMSATGPITMAGALAQQHAEVLASFVFAAAAKPGARVVYCSRISPIDLRTATASWGGPETGISGACAAQLARRLGLPSNTYGFTSSAALIDQQHTLQRLTNAIIPALGGVDILSGVGGNDSGLVAGLGIAVMDDEMISLIRHIAAVPGVTEDTLALDVMKEVIPRDGVFLAEMHTVKHMRRGAIWNPVLCSQIEDKETSLVDRARDRAKGILQTHRVEPLPDDVVRHLDEIIERAQRELVRE